MIVREVKRPPSTENELRSYRLHKTTHGGGMLTDDPWFFVSPQHFCYLEGMRSKPPTLNVLRCLAVESYGVQIKVNGYRTLFSFPGGGILWGANKVRWISRIIFVSWWWNLMGRK